MKFLLLSAFVAFATSQALAISEDEDAQWKLFKETHKKWYASKEEEQQRWEIFLDNLKFVREHNAQYERGEVNFDVEMNKFGDMTTEEVATTMMGLKIPIGEKRIGQVFDDSKDIEIPHIVDWRKKGVLTPVKYQGNCGSCWAFSATGSIESQHFLKTQELVSLSEQNLVDCTFDEGNFGCNGGYMDNAFTYVIKNNGIDTEASYPYEQLNTTCRYNPNNKGATVRGFVDIPEGNETALQRAVAQVGPISICIDAYHKSFVLYKKGVYSNPLCSTTVLSHAELIVGYGNDKRGGAFWRMKNSWGVDWGNKGYMKVARNDNNMCGLATRASYPLV